MASDAVSRADQTAPPSAAFIFARNSATQAIEQAICIVLGFVGTIAIARWAGPAAFGVWTLALVIARLAHTLAAYGMDTLTVRECEAQDARARRFLVNTIALRIINVALVLTVGAASLLWFVPETDPRYATLAGILVIIAPVLLLTPLESLELWFRAGRNALAPALARVSATGIGTILKLLVIAAGGSLTAMAGAHAIQVAMLGMVLLLIYMRGGSALRLRDIELTKILATYRDAIPLFVAQLAVVLALRTDLFVLWWLRSEHEVGIYAASLRICEAAFILPVVLMNAAAPLLFRLRKIDVRRYVERFRLLLTLFTIGAIGVSILVALLAPTVVPLAFGSRYSESASVLAIQIFSLVGISHAVATECWWVERRRHSVIMLRTLAGAATMLVFALLLVPFWGAHGAALAAVLAQLTANVGMHMIMGRSGRHLAHLQLRPSFHGVGDLKHRLWIRRMHEA